MVIKMSTQRQSGGSAAPFLVQLLDSWRGDLLEFKGRYLCVKDFFKY